MARKAEAIAKKAKTKLTKKEEAMQIKELKSKLSREELNSLEQMIEKNGGEINLSELRGFLREQNIDTQNLQSSPSLQKINAPQRNPVRLERIFADSAVANPPIIINTNNANNDEENEIQYNLTDKKPEQEYHVMKQDYNSIQREMLKKNTNMSVKRSTFVDPRKINLTESFPRRDFGIVADENIRDAKDVDKNYITKTQFVDKDRKISRNPFDKKEIKYTPEV